MPPTEKTLCLATSNPHKIEELRALFAPLLPGIRLVSLDEAGGPFPEVSETEKTFEGNAILKAKAYAKLTGLPALADDSGLCVAALDGRPGVQSSRYAPTPAERIDRVLREVADAEKVAVSKGAVFSRGAQFVCVMACAFPDGKLVLGEGKVGGAIRDRPEGTSGFGYDPIFYLSDMGKTMAQLSPDAKNAISHRGRAARAIADKIKPLFNGGK
jgi:XTP/dITP diphosphohydrolase